MYPTTGTGEGELCRQNWTLAVSTYTSAALKRTASELAG